MAVHSDYLQNLIDRNDLYDPSPPIAATRPTLRRSQPIRRVEGARVDAIRLLLTLCICSWSVVAVETWLLVR